MNTRSSFKYIVFSTVIVLCLIPVAKVLKTQVFSSPELQYVQGISSSAVSPVKQTLLYKAPQWGRDGPLLSVNEVVSRYSNVVYARSQMASYLPGYTAGGFTGTALVYLIMDEIQGPAGLSSVASQTTLCTEAQRQLAVYSGNAAMDRGDFCEIHDAIIRGTALQDYPEIYPTEDWFLHKSNGNRYIRAGENFSYYRPNPGNEGWRKYFALRALRELTAQDPNHLPVPGVDGLFIDNVDLAWDKVLKDDNGTPPREYTNNDSYMAAVLGFVEHTHTKLHSGNNNFPVWGNMITDTYSGTSWDAFIPYLEGGMTESFLLKWGQGPRPTATMLNELAQAETWIGHGKQFLGEAQGDGNNAYNKFVLGGYLLIADGDRATYKYTRYLGSSSEYYEIPEYYATLGLPLGAKELVTTNPLVYKRTFACGVVTVNFTTANANIETSTCIPTTPTLITKNLLAVDDAYVASNFPNKTYGADAGLTVDRSNDKISYLKFKTSEVKNKTVTDAVLVVNIADVPFAGSKAKQTIGIASNSNWQEETVSYNSRPSRNTSIGTVTMQGGERGEQIYINVKSLVQNIQGDYLTFIISTNQQDSLGLDSKEFNNETHRPKLQITYQQ